MTVTYVGSQCPMKLHDDMNDEKLKVACTAAATHRVVLQPFAHFFAVLSKNEAIADQALEGRLPKQRCREHHQSVEPASCLINSYTVITRGGLTGTQGQSHAVVVGIHQSEWKKSQLCRSRIEPLNNHNAWKILCAQYNPFGDEGVDYRV